MESDKTIFTEVSLTKVARKTFPTTIKVTTEQEQKMNEDGSMKINIEELRSLNPELFLL